MGLYYKSTDNSIEYCIRAVVKNYRKKLLKNDSTLREKINEQLNAEEIIKTIKEELEKNTKGNKINKSERFIADGQVVIGDIHGQLGVLISNLYGLGAIDTKGNWSAPNNSEFVQVGDVIDRGKYSLETHVLLKALQKQIKREGKLSKLVTLLGNHEAYLCEHGQKCATDPKLTTYDPQIMRKMIIEDMKSGKIQLAHGNNKENTIVTHAEISVETKKEAVKMILQEKAKNQIYKAKYKSNPQNVKLKVIEIKNDLEKSLVELSNLSSEIDLSEFNGKNEISVSRIATSINSTIMSYATILEKPQELITPELEATAYKFVSGGLSTHQYLKQINPEEKMKSSNLEQYYFNGGGILWRRDLSMKAKANDPIKQASKTVPGVMYASENKIYNISVNIVGHTPVGYTGESRPKRHLVFVDNGTGKKDDRFGAFISKDGKKFTVFKGIDGQWYIKDLIKMAFEMKSLREKFIKDLSEQSFKTENMQPEIKKLVPSDSFYLYDDSTHSRKLHILNTQRKERLNSMKSRIVTIEKIKSEKNGLVNLAQID